jgi:hypothetical protein
MKPQTASTLAASHRSPEDGRSMASDDRQEESLAALAALAPIACPGQGVMGPNAARKTVSLGVPAGFHP